MFAKLAFKNVKRSIKDYAIYFFTLVLGVAIFYVFNTLDSQSVMLDVNEQVKSILEITSMIMQVVSVFVSVILGALIIYASRFLIKRRSKEFGIYLMLGMSKRKVSLILLLETFLIGLFSLFVGLILGIIGSQFMSVLVANMFDANMTNFHFVFSGAACVQTLIYFGIIYVVVMIFNTIIVSRQRLINLLSASRRNEKVKLKNLWLCTIVFIVACIILGRAYYLVTDGIGFVKEVRDLLKPIIMGIVATFLLFWSLSGMLLRFFMSFKKIYYNKLNAFVLRQFSSKINTTVASMSLICLMLFVTICILGSALSINATLHENIEKSLPVDVEIESIGSKAADIRETYRREEIDLDEILTDIETYRTFALESFQVTDGLGFSEAVMDSDSELEFVSYGSYENLVYVSDYNKVAATFNLPVIDLSDDEYAVLANYKPMLELRNQALQNGTEITINNQTLKPKFDKCIEGTIELEMSNMNSGLIILPDNLKVQEKDTITNRQFLLGNYRDSSRIAESEKQLMQISNRFFGDNGAEIDDDEQRIIYYYNVSTRQDIIDNNVGTSALVTFIGLYLGIIFLISSAAVLALKELSESSDNRNKYEVLRKIGASNSILNRALFWQIFIFFLFPLLIAIIHSIFGLMFCDFILMTLGGVDIGQSLPMITLILVGIYGGYFVITYVCSRNIIKERRV